MILIAIVITVTVRLLILIMRIVEVILLIVEPLTHIM